LLGLAVFDDVIEPVSDRAECSASGSVRRTLNLAARYLAGERPGL
jgi:hypothetical protein